MKPTKPTKQEKRAVVREGLDALLKSRKDVKLYLRYDPYREDRPGLMRHLAAIERKIVVARQMIVDLIGS